MENANDILNRIIEDRPPIAPEGERFHKALMRHFEGKRNKVMAVMTAWLVLCLTLMSLGLYILGTSDETRTMLIGVVVLLAGLESSILIKLWYWIVDNKISVVKALKETQLIMLRPAPGAAVPESPQSDGSVGSDGSPQAVLNGFVDVAPTFWERFDPAQMRRRVGWFVAVAAVVIVGIPTGMMAGLYSKAGIRQEDEWHFASSGQVMAESTLIFSRSPRKATLDLALPYENATVLSVKSDDGQELTFSNEAPGRCSVATGSCGASTRAIRVYWVLPIDALEPSQSGYRVRLRSLLPVDAYSLKSFIDPDGPYQIHDDPKALSFVPFRGTYNRPTMEMGSCSSMVEKRGQAPVGAQVQPETVR